MRVLVTGASGRLGSAIVASLPYEVIAPSRQELDLNDAKHIPETLDRLLPDAVINAAAYTDVDRAETERDAAMRINSDAPQALAAWSASRNVPIIHISTDFVFSGSGTLPWSERAEPEPINHYGVTKLRGENGVREAGGEHLVIRTSWLFGRHGKSFLRSILAAAAQGSEIKVLHLTNLGWVSRAGFAAAAIAEAARVGVLSSPTHVVEVSTSSLASPAERPLNSRLDCTKAASEFGVTLPSWDDALGRSLQGFSL